MPGAPSAGAVVSARFGPSPLVVVEQVRAHCLWMPAVAVSISSLELIHL